MHALIVRASAGRACPGRRETEGTIARAALLPASVVHAALMKSGLAADAMWSWCPQSDAPKASGQPALLHDSAELLAEARGAAPGWVTHTQSADMDGLQGLGRLPADGNDQPRLRQGDEAG